MTSKLTKERIEWLNYAATGLAANGTEMAMSPQDVIALTEYCLTAMDSEPVAVVEPSDYVTAAQLVGEGPARKAVRELYEGALRIGDKLYRHAQPAPELTATVERLNASGYEYEGEEVTPQNVAAVVDILLQQLNDAVQGRDAQPEPIRDQVRREHAEWSQATFGDVGPIGPLKHLSKEALEAAADPHDPLEWADMQFLFWDAQRRMGISDEFITRAMVEKLAINKVRQWPEPKDGEPRLHTKEQPAPLVLDEIECDICGHVSTDPEGRHHCCEDNSND